jgi:hypothetical protein
MTRKHAVFWLMAIATLFSVPAAANAATPIIAVASIGEVQKLNGDTAPVVQVLSYHPGHNRGGGLLIWNADSAAPVDDCVTFAAKDGRKGRWVRQLPGALDATMCGAYWDNVHDDAAVLTHAFAVASALRVSLSLPAGEGKICSTVTAARAVIVRGQGMGTLSDAGPSPTIVNGSCMKSGWVFDITTPNGQIELEAPKYYDMEIQAGGGKAPGGCIRWNSPTAGFTDSPASQYYMMHPHAERIYCILANSEETGFMCSKCFDGDFSQNAIIHGKTGIDIEGSDVMCIGCAGPNRIAYSSSYLIRMVAHGNFGNMDRIVGNEILFPNNTPSVYDAMIFDSTRSSTIESNHIEAVLPGIKSAIHVVGGFSHAIDNNYIDVLTQSRGDRAAPNWLIAEGPFTNFRAFNNGCAGCTMGPALFTNKAREYNPGFVPQIITHGGNGGSGDSGFPFNTIPAN